MSSGLLTTNEIISSIVSLVKPWVFSFKLFNLSFKEITLLFSSFISLTDRLLVLIIKFDNALSSGTITFVLSKILSTLSSLILKDFWRLLNTITTDE